VRYIILCMGLVALAAGAATLEAGEPGDTWMKAIRSGAVTSAWAGAEDGRIISAGLEVERNAGVEGVVTNGAAGGRDVMLVDSSDPKYNGPQFIYGNVPDWLRKIARMEIVIEYFDAGPGTIPVTYSSPTLDGATARTRLFLSAPTAGGLPGLRFWTRHAGRRSTVTISGY